METCKNGDFNLKEDTKVGNRYCSSIVRNMERLIYSSDRDLLLEKDLSCEVTSSIKKETNPTQPNPTTIPTVSTRIV
jgi:hypothetical protein